MKINVKMFNSLTDPFKVNEIDGKVIEFHYMNDTNYLAQYAGQGYFYELSSDGETYKFLVEKGFYETLDDLFLPEVNLLQIKFYESLLKTRRNLFYFLTLPVLVLVIAAIALAMFIPQFAEYRMPISLGAIFVLIIVTLFSNTTFKNRMNRIRENHLLDLQEFLGEERFENLAIKQNEYHRNYFNFDDVAKPQEEEQLEHSEEGSEPQVVPVWVSGSESEVSEPKEVDEVEVVEDELELEKEVETEKPAKEEVKKETSEQLVVKKEVAEVPTGEVDLNVLGMELLKDFARDRKISGFSTMRKSELLAALPSEYSALRVVELQALARHQQIPNFSTMRKGELIEALKHGIDEEFEEVEEAKEKPVFEEVAEEKPKAKEVVVAKETGDLERLKVVEDDGSVDLNILVMDDLKEFVKARKVSGFSTMRKAELVEAMPNNIHDLRLIELRALGREYGLAHFSTMRKDELIDELIKGLPIKTIVEPKPEVEKETINVLNEDGTVNLSLLNLEELKVFAKERKVLGFSTMRKSEIIDALPKEISELRTNELRALAKVKKVSKFSTMRKVELIEAIK